MEERDQIDKLIETFVQVEKDRNKLFNKALHIFLYTVVGVVLIMSIGQIVLFASMFE